MNKTYYKFILVFLLTLPSLYILYDNFDGQIMGGPLFYMFLITGIPLIGLLLRQRWFIPYIFLLIGFPIAACIFYFPFAIESFLQDPGYPILFIFYCGLVLYLTDIVKEDFTTKRV